MKVIVTVPFWDKYEMDRFYNVEDIVDFDNEDRVSNLVSRGLVKVKEESVPEKKKAKDSEKGV
ncbi:MAG: hypothetical protein LBH58_02675 [Tannerellaceae bacterium]|jgi:hypothetical protein|nr:hypothetical protein [Tannerellaceae bacterium]